MPTYEYETPHGILEIDAKDEAESVSKLKASLQSLDYQAKKKTAESGAGPKVESTWEYIKDAVAGQTAEVMGGLNKSTAYLPGLTGMMVNAFRGGPPTQGAPEIAPGLAAKMNYEGLSPADSMQAIAGEAAKGVAHPGSYIGPGGPLAKTVMAAIAPAGGEVSSQIAQGFGAEKGGAIDTTARLAGSIGTAYPVAAASRFWEKASDAGKRMMSGETSEKALKALEEETNRKVITVLQSAMKADPSFKSKVQAALYQAKQSGVASPVTALVENPVIKAHIAYLAKNNQEFHGKYFGQLDDAFAQLQAAKRGVFGSPARAADTISDFTAKTPEQIAQESAARQAARINKPIEEEAIAATQKAFPAAQREADELRRLERVLGEDLKVSPVASKQYTEIDAEAGKAGAVLSPQSAKALAAVAASAAPTNPFHRYPQLLDRVEKVIGEAPTSMTYADARGLQIEINKLLRSDIDQADKWQLGRLKDSLEEMMYQDMPEFAQRLRDANMRYAYDSNMLDFTMFALDKKTGMLNPTRAAEWIANARQYGGFDKIVAYDESLGKLDLAKAIGDPAMDITKILKRRVDADNFIGQVKVKQFFKGEDPDEIASLLMRNGNKGKAAIREFGRDPDAMKALRSYMLDFLTRPGKIFSEAFETPAAESNLNQLFGPGYTNVVKRLGGISDKLNVAAKQRNITAELSKTEQGIIESSIGVPASMIFSKFRNPIISFKQAAFELISKGATTKQREALDKELMNVFSDPQRFVKLVKNLEDIPASDVKGVSDYLKKALKWGAIVAKESATTGIRASFGAAAPTLMTGGDQ